MCAIVVTPAGADPLTIPAMQDFLKGKGLRIHAFPERLEVVEVIARNASGKIPKHELRKQYSGG